MLTRTSCQCWRTLKESRRICRPGSYITHNTKVDKHMHKEGYNWVKGMLTLYLTSIALALHMCNFNWETFTKHKIGKEGLLPNFQVDMQMESIVTQILSADRSVHTVPWPEEPSTFERKKNCAHFFVFFTNSHGEKLTFVQPFCLPYCC